MFTGIVQNLGTIESVQKEGDLLRLQIKTTLAPRALRSGNSVAVEGVCLTVETFEPKKKRFWVTAVQETLKKTTLGLLRVGDPVHLEPALTPRDFLGGHFVSGHVDGLGTVLRSAPDLLLKCPSELMKFFPQKGSVAVNGVSLTIASVTDDSISIAVIPETLQKTKLGSLQTGDSVNLEIDGIARYLEHLLSFRS